MSGWLDGDDPWLTRRMRDVAAIADGETEIGIAVLTAIHRYLDIARAAVLGEPTPSFAVQEPELPPPNLDAWPPETVWLELLSSQVIPAVGTVYGGRFGQQVPPGVTVDDRRWKSAYLSNVEDRLRYWPAGVFDQVRQTLLEGMEAGEGHRAMRARVGAVLNIDARSRAAQQGIDAQTKIIDDPESTPTERKDARRERGNLYQSQDIADAEWQWKAARISRTETIGAMNGGTYAGARFYEEATGETKYKQWWATHDNRVRDSHWAAHMQVQPLSEPFSVGGFSLAHPGDTAAPGSETINCRCSLLILSPAEAQEEQKRYAALRPGRRNIDGEQMDDAGNPITPGEDFASTSYTFSSIATSQNGSTVMDQETLPPAAPPPPEDKPLPVGWRGVLAPLNTPSADDRMLLAEPGAELDVRPLPLPFKFQDEQWDGHAGAFGVGNITRVWRDPETDMMWGSGPFDLGDPRAAQVARKVGDGYQGWVSVDLDSRWVSEYRWVHDGQIVDEPTDGAREIEAFADWRLSSATLVMDQAFPEAKVWPVYDLAEITPAHEAEQHPAALAMRTTTPSDAAGAFTVIGDTALPWAPREHEWDAAGADARVAEWAGGVGSIDPEKYSRAFLYRDPDADPALVGSYKLGFADVVDGELRAVFRGVAAAAGRLDQTQMAPADLSGVKGKLRSLYESAAKAFNDDSITPPEVLMAAMTASAAPIAAPMSAFYMPEPDHPVPWTITDDGYVYGHAGCYKGVPGATPHIGHYLDGRKTYYAPRECNYDRFNNKPYRVQEGQDILVGCVVFDTNHAPVSRYTTAGEAIDHYAHTGARAAYVRTVAGKFGPWTCGVLAPDLTPEKTVAVRALTLSGDWREIDGEVSFVAALGVNTEAINVPRPRQATDSDGRLLALVAACPVLPPLTGSDPTPQVRTRYVVADPQQFAAAIVAEQRAEATRRRQAAQLASRVFEQDLAKLAARVRPDGR